MGKWITYRFFDEDGSGGRIQIDSPSGPEMETSMITLG